MVPILLAATKQDYKVKRLPVMHTQVVDQVVTVVFSKLGNYVELCLVCYFPIKGLLIKTNRSFQLPPRAVLTLLAEDFSARSFIKKNSNTNLIANATMLIGSTSSV